MALQPADLGRHVGGIEHDPGRGADALGRHALDLGLGAPVHPDDAGRQRLPVPVDRDAAVELAGDAERPDRLGRAAGRVEGAGDRRAERLLPEPRILLGPARAREGRPVGDRRLAPQAAARRR